MVGTFCWLDCPRVLLVPPGGFPCQKPGGAHSFCGTGRGLGSFLGPSGLFVMRLDVFFSFFISFLGGSFTNFLRWLLTFFLTRLGALFASCVAAGALVFRGHTFSCPFPRVGFFTPFVPSKTLSEVFYDVGWFTQVGLHGLHKANFFWFFFCHTF